MDIHRAFRDISLQQEPTWKVSECGARFPDKIKISLKLSYFIIDSVSTYEDIYYVTPTRTAINVRCVIWKVEIVYIKYIRIHSDHEQHKKIVKAFSGLCRIILITVEKSTERLFHTHSWIFLFFAKKFNSKMYYSIIFLICILHELKSLMKIKHIFDTFLVLKFKLWKLISCND